MKKGKIMNKIKRIMVEKITKMKRI